MLLLSSSRLFRNPCQSLVNVDGALHPSLVITVVVVVDLDWCICSHPAALGAGEKV